MVDTYHVYNADNNTLKGILSETALITDKILIKLLDVIIYLWPHFTTVKLNRHYIDFMDDSLHSTEKYDCNHLSTTWSKMYD